VFFFELEVYLLFLHFWICQLIRHFEKFASTVDVANKRKEHTFKLIDGVLLCGVQEPP
jgi:hypothetical protein